MYLTITHIKPKAYRRSRNWRFAKNEKSCSLKYKSRKILEIFLKNGLYRFVKIDFCMFGPKFKMMVRNCKHINRLCILTIAHIKIKSVRSFDKLAVRKNRRNSFGYGFDAIDWPKIDLLHPKIKSLKN